jgi:hypothetical protein
MGDGRLSVGPPPMQEIELPTPAERSMLLRIVFSTYPELNPRQRITGDVARVDLGAANYEQHFAAALTFLAYCKRGDFDTQRSPFWWLESCREWLREKQPGASSLVTMPPFLTAVCASGIRHGPLSGRTAYVELGLVAHSLLSAPIAGWRDVLENRQLAPDVELPGRATAPMRSRAAR